MAKDTYLKKVLGPEKYAKIRASKVLLVGAGGIGCELLKDLVLSGFGEIHIVDLDTITLSNLNRQFLFRLKDIDMLKSLTVALAVQSFNYFDSKLIPHHGNVMNLIQFPIEWWGQFDYIYNALDNLEARRYVNRMALFLRKPLMESGTTGFDGQIQPIYPYVTECFECQVKATPTTFPVCTIRSTPSQPVHCIVWAKEYLFNQLFGDSQESGVNRAELSKETDDDEEIQRILSEANELSALKSSIGSSDFGFDLIRKIYHSDVEKSLRLESLWKTRQKPVPLNFNENYATEMSDMLANDANMLLLSNDTKEWSTLENLYVLVKSTIALQRRLQGGETIISFDKDDEDTLNFVAAAANLRSHVFHIQNKTKFDIKQIAGNIIPAIATTNAIISGFSNLGSLQHFSEAPHPELSKTVFISIKPNKRATSALVEKPNPKCASCGITSKAIVNVSDRVLDMTLREFIDSVIEKYGYGGDVSIILGNSKLIYDFDFEDNAEKKLKDINGFVDNEVILIQDDDDELQNLELLIHFQEGGELQLPEVKLNEKVKITEKEEEEQEEESYSGTEAIVIDEDEPPTKKRRIDDSFIEIEIV